MVDDTLSYHSMLTILRDAAVGGMTAGKFSTLETLASLLNAPGGIEVSGYVKSITKSVIDGDPANATWTGGSSTPSRSATSTPTRRNAYDEAHRQVVPWNRPAGFQRRFDRRERLRLHV